MIGRRAGSPSAGTRTRTVLGSASPSIAAMAGPMAVPVALTGWLGCYRVAVRDEGRRAGLDSDTFALEDPDVLRSLRFTLPFRAVTIPARILIGDRVAARIRVVAKRETRKPDRGIVTIAVTPTNQRGATVQQGENDRMAGRRVNA